MTASVLKYTIKSFGTCLAVLLFSVGALTAQNKSQATFTESTHDFGRINEVDGPVTAVFEFTNTSDAPFIIDFVSVSCGCTTPQFSREPVLPGKKGSITVTYDPAGRPGVFHRTLVVTSNNRRDQTQLYIKGEVVGKPRSVEEQFPSELHTQLRGTANTVLMGYVPRGTSKSQTIDIYNASDKPVAVHYVPASSKDEKTATVTVIPSTVPAKGRAQVEVVYDLSQADAWGQQNFSFFLTADGQPSRLPVTVYATVTEDFSGMTDREKENAPKAAFSSQYHNFNKAQRNKTLSKTFEMKNEGKSPLIVRHIGNPSPHLEYTIDQTTVAPGRTATITLRLKTGNQPAKLSESITLVLNDPARPVRELRVGATVE